MQEKRRIGDILVSKGILKIGDIEKAVSKQKDKNMPLGEILVSKNLINYDHIVDVLVEQGFKRKNCLSLEEIEQGFNGIDEDFWVDNLIVPFKYTREKIEIIMYNPSDTKSLNILRRELNINAIDVYVDSRDNIESKLCKLFDCKYKIQKEKELEGKEKKNKGVFYLSVGDSKENVVELVKHSLEIGEKVVIEKDSVDGLYKMTIY